MVPAIAPFAPIHMKTSVYSRNCTGDIIGFTWLSNYCAEWGEDKIWIAG
jgi:hypothetical protein